MQWRTGVLTCAGYVAVSERLEDRGGERDLVVVFRGTQAKTEWISDIVWQMVPWSELQQAGDSDIKVAKVMSCLRLLLQKHAIAFLVHSARQQAHTELTCFPV